MNEGQAERARRYPSPEEIERAARAFELSACKLTVREIAAKMGTSRGTAHRLITRGMRFYLKDHGAEDTKRQILGRLNAMLEAILPKALEGDEGAIDRVLKIDKRLAELYGLDAPKDVRVEWIPADGVADELARLRALRAARHDAIPAESRVS